MRCSRRFYTWVAATLFFLTSSLWLNGQVNVTTYHNDNAPIWQAIFAAGGWIRLRATALCAQCTYY